MPKVDAKPTASAAMVVSDPLTLRMLRLYRSASKQQRSAFLRFMLRIKNGVPFGKSTYLFYIETGFDEAEAMAAAAAVSEKAEDCA